MAWLSENVDRVVKLFHDSILCESSKDGILRQKLKTYTKCFAMDNKKLQALLVDDEKHWQ